MKQALKMLAAVLVLGLAAWGETLPAGTHVTVRLGSALSSASARPGETWEGTLARDVIVNGQTMAKAGTPVKGVVVNAKPSGRLKNPGVLSLRLTSISINGTPTAVHTATVTRQGQSHKKSNAEKIGGGAAAGAVIGAIAGGGKGAAIGTAAGGAAGTGAAAYTGKKDVVFPAESALSFTVVRTALSARSARHK